MPRPDNDEAADIVRRLVDAIPSGSFVAISHPTTEVNGPVMLEALRFWNEGPAAKMVLRSAAEVVRLFDGLEMLDPGVVTCSQWPPDTKGTPDEVAHYDGVGRKP